MQFDSKTGYITVTIGDRTQIFRVEPGNGYSILRHAEDSHPWCPPRTATMEEEVMYTAIARNSRDTVAPVAPAPDPKGARNTECECYCGCKRIVESRTIESGASFNECDLCANGINHGATTNPPGTATPDTGRERLAAAYVRSLLALGDLRRFVHACDSMGTDKFGACHWCKRHLGSASPGHLEGCELMRAVKAAKDSELATETNKGTDR